MNNFNTKQRFSIRKYHIGAASVLLGAFIGLNTTAAQAEETTPVSNTTTVENSQPVVAPSTENVTPVATPAAEVAPVVGEPVIAESVSNQKVNVSPEFVDALKKRELEMGNDYENLAPVKDRANFDKLKAEGQKLFDSNTYTKSNDDRTVDLWNLTEEEKKEINDFGVDVINQYRVAFGNKELQTGSGVYEFNKEIADSRQKVYTDPNKYLQYDYAKINETAKKYGIAQYNEVPEENKTASDLSTKQQQQDIITVELNDTVKWDLPTVQFTDKNSTWSNIYSEKDHEHFSQQKPLIKMEDLKENIFNQIKRLVFTPNPGGRTENRHWEFALSTVGQASRRNMAFGAAAVTANVLERYDRVELDKSVTWKKYDWSTRKEGVAASDATHKYRELRLTLHTSYVAPFNSPKNVTLSGEELTEHNKVLDVNKFLVPTRETIELKPVVVYQEDKNQPFGYVNPTEGKPGKEVKVTTYTMDTAGKITPNTPTVESKEDPINTVIVKGTKPTERPETIVKGTRYEANPELEANTKNVKTAGKDGSKVFVTEYDFDAATGIVTPKAEVLKAGSEVAAEDQVIEVGTKPKVDEKVLPFKVEYKEDPNLEEGKERVETVGVSGKTKTTTTYTLNTNTGEVINNDPIVVVVKEPVSEIRYKGTKKPTTEPPVTEPPVTEPPVTEPPVTEPPVTEPPVTEPPVTEPPVQGLGNTGNNNDGSLVGSLKQDPKQPLEIPGLNGGNNGQVTPPTQGTNKPGQQLRNTGIVPPLSVSGKGNTSLKSNAGQKVTEKATSSANALPKTTATTETNSALPAGLAAALAAAGLLAVKRRKED